MTAASTRSLFTRRASALALFLFASCFVAVVLTGTSSPFGREEEATPTTNEHVFAPEPPDVVAFRQSVGGDITPVFVELHGEPGFRRKIAAEQQGQPLSITAIGNNAVALWSQQTAFLQGLPARGVRALLRQASVPQIDGSIRHIEYRFTYLMNGFIAYVATEDIPKLQMMPEVADVSVPEPEQYHLDKAVDYALGTQPNPADRRTAVYGPTQEFTGTGETGHPETPRPKIDGFEGQGINIAVIDSGVDWRHPMFGGTGHTTPMPRVSGQAESPADNKKVIYYYALSSPGDPTDDFGHGTHVASTAAGYAVDGNTTPRTGYGTGRDGTGVGPTINGAQLFGSAPQARVMAYKVCGPATNCLGDTPLSIEDAASPVTLVGRGDGLSEPTAVPKPVADVINMSLGSTAGDPAAANSRAANNAALAGVIVVASAGNSGPGLATVGNPGTAAMVISTGASLDPGSVAGSDVLGPNQVPSDLRAPALPGPTPEVGASSNANTPQPGERQGMRIFPVAGGGPLPAESTPTQPVDNTGSLSAHYVFVDRRNAADPVPSTVGNRIALVKFTGAFAGAANTLAAQPVPPAAILLISNTESATAVQVIRGIPTFTINENDGNYLIDRMITGDPGDGDNNVDVPQGTISELPLRLAETISLPAFPGVMAGFSSRGPSDHPNAAFRVIKPDVASPGVGVVAAATTEGIPEETIGMASLQGYVSANGTSMASPLNAGAMALIRQRVREQLNLDSTDTTDPQYTAKRFDTMTVARAMLQNSATNLRSGLGVPQGDGAASSASINDMGAGHINIAGALQADAIMVSPTRLLTNPREYTPEATPSPSPSATPVTRTVMLPTASFAAVPVVKLNESIVRTREVIIRDVTGGAGSGTYNLTVQNNRNLEHPGFQVSLTGTADSATPITSISVPSGGQASFFVRTVADGAQILIDPTEFQWYVTATHSNSAKTLRMPFYYRAVTALFPSSAAPVLEPVQETEMPPTTGCPIDTNGQYRLNYTYTSPPNLKFRVQEATESVEFFFDNADEPLQPNAVGTTLVTENSRWRDAGISGTPQTPPQWTTNANPNTGSPAYFIADAAAQNHSLTMKNGIDLPNTGITLSFDTTYRLDNNFDYGFVEVSTDNLNYFPVLSLTGNSSGTRNVDLSGYAGKNVKIRFRLFSAEGVSTSGGAGWWVENIRIKLDDFRTIAEPPPGEKTLGVAGRFNGTYLYRVAAIYENPLDAGTTITGPYSNIQCVTVTGNPLPAPAPGLIEFSAPTYAIGENGGSATITVTRSGGSAGEVTVNYATSDGSATAGQDYTSASGTLTFASGEASKEFTVPIIDDATPEPQETVTLTLSNPGGGAALGTRSTATLTIIDDQGGAGPGALQFSSANYSEAENTQNAQITVTRTGGTEGTVSVSYTTSDGTANAGTDYTSTSGTLTFGPGEVTKTFNVPLIDDPAAEPDETVTLTLSNATGGATLGNPSTATLTILDTDRGGPPAQLLNISTRLRVQTGEKVGIGGFIITGTGAKRVLLRGIGPSLTSNGVPVEGRLQDPAIELYDGNGILITSNDNWKDSPDRAEIESSGLAPNNDAEAAIARTVPPGAYTGVLYGANGSEGIGVVEAYDRDRGGASEMANISTRGFVESGDNVLIGGFIAGARSGATNVIVRAIGPSLTAKGVSDALQDPSVELYDANGTVIDSSDDWKTSGDQAEVIARGLAPQDDRESAAFHLVPPGSYTAIVRGKDDTTGVGLVEIYNVQ